jgi:RimJ/RimL family protein N-acetyltransferase
MPSVQLRALEPSDAPEIHAWRQEPAYRRGILTLGRYTSRATEEGWLDSTRADHEAGRAFTFGIVHADDGRLVGMVALKPVDYLTRSASVRSVIGRPEDRRKGFLAQGRRLALEFAFFELGLNRVESRVLTTNTASINSIERAGYRREGLLRQAAFKDGAFVDVAVYGLLRSEFEALIGRRDPAGG